MPQTIKDQFFLIDPYSPPPIGTPLVFERLEMTDQNDDNDFDRFNGDSVDGSDITSSWPGDVVRVNVPGVGLVTYTGITFYLADGRRAFTPNDGQVLQNGTLSFASGVTTQGPLTVAQAGPTCFTPGTMIDAQDGPVPVESLKDGDLVRTRDHGIQPIRQVRRRTVQATGEFAPVLIQRDTFGRHDELLVSQQHRIMVRDWRAELWFGAPEVLVAARHLVDGNRIRLKPGGDVTYIHLVLDQHEILVSNGLQTESYFIGHAARAEERELATLFPDLAEIADLVCTARPVLRRREAVLLGV